MIDMPENLKKNSSAEPVEPAFYSSVPVKKYECYLNGTSYCHQLSVSCVIGSGLLLSAVEN